MTENLTIERVRAEVKRMDPNVDENSSEFRSAVILLSALVVGPRVREVATFTGYKYRDVAERFRRLRASGVVRQGQLSIQWFDEDGGGIAFWLDVLVAEGMMARTDTQAESSP